MNDFYFFTVPFRDVFWGKTGFDEFGITANVRTKDWLWELNLSK